LWERQVDPSDTEALAQLEADLDEAERQLSSYRNALHVRLGDATSELIARYRDEPNLCLSALPVQRRRGRVA
jgi:outer membrane protein TolC